MLGNRCNHDRANPRVHLVRPLSERLPLVIKEAMARTRGIVLERARFPELGGRRGLQLRFTNGRERRSERLEALTLVMQAILCRMDLVTLRAGTVRADGSCLGITEEDICTWTRVRPRRVRRAIRDLRDAGYLGWHQPRKKLTPEKWRAYPAIRSVTMTYFKRCGLRPWLERERVDASERRRRTVTPIDIRARRELQRVVRVQAMAAKRARLAKTTITEEEKAAAIRRMEAQLGLRKLE